MSNIRFRNWSFFGKDMNLAFKMISEISKISNSKQPLLLKSEILHDKEICLKDSLRETYISKSGIKKVSHIAILLKEELFH